MSSTLAVSDLGHAIAQSNMPAPEKKTAIRALYDRLTAVGVGAAIVPAMGYVREGLQIVRGATGSLGAGVAYGYMHHHFGSLDVGKNKDIPVDGVGAGLSYLAAMALANDPMGLSNDARNLGNVSLGILVERKSKVFFDKRLSGASAHGGDPIAEAAKEFQ